MTFFMQIRFVLSENCYRHFPEANLGSAKMALQFLHEAVEELILDAVCRDTSISLGSLGTRLKEVLGLCPKKFLNLVEHDKDGKEIGSNLPKSLHSYLEWIPYLSVRTGDVSSVELYEPNEVFSAWKSSEGRLCIVKQRNALLIEACKILLENLPGQIDPNRKGRNGNSLLHLIAALPSNSGFYNGKNEKYLTLLLKNGADPRVKNDDGWTPLHIVAGGRSMIDMDGNLRVSNEARVIPEKWPSTSRYKQLQILTDQGIFAKEEFASCVNVRGNEGNTILHEWILAAVKAKVTHDEVALGSFILSLGVLPSVSNDMGCTPLHYAFNAKLFDLLISKGSSHERRNDKGETPLLSVIKHGIVGGENRNELLAASESDSRSAIQSIISIVSASNDDLLARDQEGNHAIDVLLKSISEGHYKPTQLSSICKAVMSLLECCTTQILEIKDPTTPVEAVFNCVESVCAYAPRGLILDNVRPLLRVLETMLEKGVSPNGNRGPAEPTFLHNCCKPCSLPPEVVTELIIILRTHGADINLTDDQGKTPKDVLRQRGRVGDRLLKTLCDTQPKTTVQVSFKTKVHKKALQKLCVSSPRKIDCYRYDPAVSIGEGSMGIVFPAIDEKGRREVALKRIQKDYKEKKVAKEIRALCTLSPCKQVVDYHCIIDSEPDFHFVVLELMEGDLAKLIQQKKKAPLDRATITMLVSHMVKGLKYLHGQVRGILHCDLKPGNVLYTNVPNLSLKLADFGLAKDLTGYSSLATTTGHSLAGTRGWMAPELVSRKQTSHTMESDVFSLGLVCHFLMSKGKHPFDPRGTVLTREAASAQSLIAHEVEVSIVNGMYHMDKQVLSPEGQDFLMKILAGESKNRLAVALAERHCYFWSNHKKIQFLMAVADQKEVAQSGKHPDILKLSDTCLGRSLKDKPWHIEIDTLYQDMTATWKHKKYDPTSLVDLVRFFRNAYSHEEERSSASKAGLMSNIFFEKFPDLLLTVWIAVVREGWAKQDPNGDRQKIQRALSLE